jgi:hypothetical protein
MAFFLLYVGAGGDAMSFRQWVNAAEDTMLDAGGNVMGMGGVIDAVDPGHKESESSFNTAVESADAGASTAELAMEEDPITAIPAFGVTAMNDTSRDLGLYSDANGNPEGCYEHAYDEGGVKGALDAVNAPVDVSVKMAEKAASDLWNCL